MLNDEDVLPAIYPYAWSNNSELPLENFLSKYRPSMVQNDGTKPWIWVRGSEPSKEDQGVEEAKSEAAALLKEVTETVENIKNDPSIPTRSNKKTGAKSKKEVRERAQAKATDKLKEISTKHGYVSGKWLIFASAEKIDMIWTSIATSLVNGPLSSTAAYLAKVATSPQTENPTHQHLICVYIPDVYDKEGVTEVMKVLLRNHGLNLSGVKSNLYTTIGIDSKHASGIPSTIWKNSTLLSDSESKALKDAFFAEVASAKPLKPVVDNPADVADKKDKSPPAASGKSKSKPKLKLKKKQEHDDPFASDDDNDEEAEEKARKQELKTKKSGGNAKRAAPSDDEDEDDDNRPKKKRS